MKNKLILMLKTLFASKGFSQKALEGLAEILVPNLTEESTTEDLTAAIEGLKPMTDIMQSEISRQVSEAKKPKPVETPTPVVPAVEPEIPTTTDPVLLALLAEIKEMKTGLTNLNTEKVANTRRDQYIKSMEGTSKEYQERELKKFDRFSFKDDDDFNSFIEDTKDDHASAAQEETNNGLGSGERPVGGVGKPTTAAEKEVSPAMKELIAERTAQAAAKTAQNA